jgi:hypothetical protein
MEIRVQSGTVALIEQLGMKTASNYKENWSRVSDMHYRIRGESDLTLTSRSSTSESQGGRVEVAHIHGAWSTIGPA